MKKHSRWIVIVVITVTIFSFLISPKNIQNDDFQPITMVNTPHSSNGGDSPITISNDSDLAMMSSSGDGNSWETAYMIENLNIYTDNVSVALLIGNTTKYCIIQNNTFTNLYDGQSSSIKLNNSSNIRMINNSVYHSYYGIYIRDSDNIQIQENTVFNNTFGLRLFNLENIIITSNRIVDYTWMGLWLNIASGNFQIQDNFYYTDEDVNTNYAIKLEYVSSFTLRNEFSRDFCRAYLLECNNFTIENCTFGGIEIVQSQNFTVRQCRVISDIIIGYSLDFSLTENVVEGSEFLSKQAFVLNCSYDYNITRNRIENYEEYAFFIYGEYHGEIPDFQPVESVERIEYNIIEWKGRALIGYEYHWNSSQAYVDRIKSQKLGWNWVIPPMSYIFMSIGIIIVVFLLITVKSKLYSNERKLDRTQIKSLHLIADYQHFFYLRLLKIGLIFGSILIPFTIINIYSNSGWITWFTGPKYRFHPDEILLRSNYTTEDFEIAQNVISIIWSIFLALYLVIALIYSRTPKMLRKQRIKFYGFQIRNIILMTVGTAILLVVLYMLMVFGFWMYIGYFFGVLMLGGILWSFLPNPRNNILKLRWKLLIGFILLILSQVIIHIVSVTDRWISESDPVILSLHFLRLTVLIGALIERGND